MLRLVKLLLVLGLAGLGTGCFGLLGGGGGGPQSSATVFVRNDMSPPASVTIDLRKVGGGTATLGTVTAGEERALTHTSGSLQGTYQLIARQSSGAAVTSREFTLFEEARVEWLVRTNTLTVSQQR